MGTKRKPLCRDLLGKPVVLIESVTRRDGKVFLAGSSLSVFDTNRGKYALFNDQGVIRGVSREKFDVVERANRALIGC